MAEGAARLAREMRRAAQVRGLTEVSRALTYATTCDEVLALAVLQAQKILLAEAALIMLTQDEELVTVRSPVGAAGRPLDRLREREQDPLRVDLSQRLGCGPQSYVLAVPLVVGSIVIGLVAVALAPEADSPPWGEPPLAGYEEEEWLLSALADQVAVAVEKMRLDEVADFRERLIGIVSHDLRNPISAISMSAQRLARIPDLSAKAQAMVGRISRSADRAEHMIRDLLDFTDIRLKGALSLSLLQVELAGIVGETVEEIKCGGTDRRIHLRQEGSSAGMFDAERMAQVVGNLLANALTYGDPLKPVEVTVTGEEKTVVLAVHNHGKHIAARARAQIFEPMYQVAADGRRAGGGLGLGLFICRHIAQAHGGGIDVSSDAIRGTTFRVTLPRWPAAEAQLT